MNPKLLGAGENDNGGFVPRGTLTRVVDVPEGLAVQDLARLSPDEIDQIIRRAGPAVGYAALIKLAAGAGGVPPQVQCAAAGKLIERAAALEAAAQDQGAAGLAGTLRTLSTDQLQAAIESMGRVVDVTKTDV